MCSLHLRLLDMSNALYEVRHKDAEYLRSFQVVFMNLLMYTNLPVQHINSLSASV
jgi:hypothetical protein